MVAETRQPGTGGWSKNVRAKTHLQPERTSWKWDEALNSQSPPPSSDVLPPAELHFLWVHNQDPKQSYQLETRWSDT